MVPTFSQDEIDAVRRYCEARLSGQVEAIRVDTLDHGAALAVLVAAFDGRRRAVTVEADGNTDDQLGAEIADNIERWIRARR